MKQISIGNCSVRTATITRNTIFWFLKKYIPKIRKIKIDVVFSNIDVYGYCIQVSERHFKIRISNKLPNDMSIIEITLHELIHLKQYVLGEMKDLANGKTKWKTKIINPYITKYSEYPWEKEAFRLSRKYADELIKEWRLLL